MAMVYAGDEDNVGAFIRQHKLDSNTAQPSSTTERASQYLHAVKRFASTASLHLALLIACDYKLLANIA